MEAVLFSFRYLIGFSLLAVFCVLDKGHALPELPVCQSG